MYSKSFVLLVLCLLWQAPIFAQQTAERLIVVNGGIFGSSSSKANLGFFDLSTQQCSEVDSIGTNSVQDILSQPDGSFYVAAGDSIIYYNRDGQRLAANAFLGVAPISMQVHNGQLLVGNWYAANSDNLHIYNAADLNYISSIAAISKGAKDMVVWNDTAYISQNEQTSNFADTAGYFALVDLTNNTFVRNQTLSNNGYDLGRLTVIEDTLYALNSGSNSITRYALATGWEQTDTASVDFSLSSTGPWEFHFNDMWLLPFDGGIGGYDIRRNALVRAPFISPSLSFKYTVDTLTGTTYVNEIDFVGQNNTGTIYDFQGNNLGNYPVGDSPELMALQYTTPVNNRSLQGDWNVQVFPNPCVERLQINLPEALFVRLIDNQGRLLRQWQLPAGLQEVQVADLVPGLYHLHFTNGRSQRTQSFVKQ